MQPILSLPQHYLVQTALQITSPILSTESNRAEDIPGIAENSTIVQVWIGMECRLWIRVQSLVGMES